MSPSLVDRGYLFDRRSGRIYPCESPGHGHGLSGRLGGGLTEERQTCARIDHTARHGPAGYSNGRPYPLCLLYRRRDPDGSSGHLCGGDHPGLHEETSTSTLSGVDAGGCDYADANVNHHRYPVCGDDCARDPDPDLYSAPSPPPSPASSQTPSP